MARRPNGEQKHILVINDTPAILDLFRDLLEEEGYRVTTDQFAVVAEQKLREVKAVKPDLLILDYIIGGEELGWQLLQMLRMDRDTAKIPVIICTAAVRQVQEMQAHLQDIGVAVVLKPFDIEHLVDEINRVWERIAQGAYRRPTVTKE